MAIAKVGSALTGNTGATTVSSQNVAITPIAGDAIVVCCSIRSGSGTLSGISATGGTATFVSRVAETTAGSAALAIWTAHNVGSGITSITLTPATSAKALVWWVQEYSGVENTLDVTSIGAAPGSSASQSSPSITPVTVGAVVIAANANAGVASTASPFSDITAGPTTHSGTTAGAGWTSEFSQWNDSSTGLDLTVASNVANTLGAYECDWTLAAAAQSGNGAIVLRPSITPASVSLVLTGGTPVLTATIPPAGGSLALSGGTPQLQTVIPPSGATLTLTASTPVLQTSIPPGGATIALTGGTPSVNLTIPPGGASLAMTGSAPVLGTAIAPNGATLALLGATPNLSETAIPASASLTLTGSTPALAVALTPTAAGLLLTGGSPELIIPVTLTPAGAALALTGETPLVLVTVMAVTPPERIITIPHENRVATAASDTRTVSVPIENRVVTVK